MAGSARQARDLARDALYVRETHVWYELDLTGERPRRELPPEVVLKKAVAEEADLVEQLGQNPDVARERLAAGNDCWLVLEEDGSPLFGCYIFRRETPVAAASGGQLRLPEGVVCLEDSVTSAAARGRGIAPGAWTGIADSLAAEGVRAMITKVGVENAPSRKAVQKSGFAEIAEMSLKRTGPRKQVALKAASASPTATALAQLLA